MPIPKPHDDEERNAFVSRCMGNPTMRDEFPDQDQRAAVCNTAWRDKDKKGQMEIERKIISVKLDGPEGSFSAQIATIDEIDRQDDIHMPGSVPTKAILVSSYNHSSWEGVLPVGRATIEEKDGHVVGKGVFNLAIALGKETHEAVKFSGELQEWSYGYRPTEVSFGERDGRRVRFLKKVDPFEISPVIKGAGIGTHTISVKGDQPFVDQVERVLLDVKALVGRAESLAALRAKDGRSISDANLVLLAKLMEDWDLVSKRLRAVASKPDNEALRVFAEYQKLVASLAVGG